MVLPGGSGSGPGRSRLQGGRVIFSQGLKAVAIEAKGSCWLLAPLSCFKDLGGNGEKLTSIHREMELRVRLILQRDIHEAVQSGALGSAGCAAACQNLVDNLHIIPVKVGSRRQFQIQAGWAATPKDTWGGTIALGFLAKCALCLNSNRCCAIPPIPRPYHAPLLPVQVATDDDHCVA